MRFGLELPFSYLWSTIKWNLEWHDLDISAVIVIIEKLLCANIRLRLRGQRK